ncbi:MAG: hypothetical protein ACRDVG_10845, partial [Jatrophihabitantaceae bacterium]
MRPPTRLHIRLAAALTAAVVLAGCTSPGTADHPTVRQPTSHATTTGRGGAPATQSSPAPPSRPPGVFTMAFAGDVHFADRVGARLARDPATVFAQAA